MIINLISGPRNVSTALMYAFAQRGDTKVVDEPFYGFYLLLTGADHPGKEEVIASMETDKDLVAQKILKLDKEGSVLFLKNMAHHHIDMDVSFLKAMTNVFLIRNPAQLIASFSKVIKNPTLDDIGIKKSWELYNELKACGQNPIVLDSGELLKNPKAMLQKLCNAIAVPFDPNMLSWNAGPRPEDGIWAKYWYANVHQSTGLVTTEAKSVEIPSYLQSLYNKAMEYYTQLYTHSIKY